MSWGGKVELELDGVPTEYGDCAYPNTAALPVRSREPDAHVLQFTHLKVKDQCVEFTATFIFVNWAPLGVKTVGSIQFLDKK